MLDAFLRQEIVLPITLIMESEHAFQIQEAVVLILDSLVMVQRQEVILDAFQTLQTVSVCILAMVQKQESMLVAFSQLVTVIQVTSTTVQTANASIMWQIVNQDLRVT